MYLHDGLYGSLRATKFNVAIVVIYFFENIRFRLILKYFARYLGLPFPCGVLSLSSFEEVVEFFES